MNELYPLKFTPILKDKIWGGSKMKNLGYDLSNLPNCGEAWLISGVAENESTVCEGWLKGNTIRELTEVYMEELLGDKVFEKYGEHFPILVKILDSADWLSIQVHPNDEMAKENGFPNGKSEMWYIMQAEKKSEIITGFKRNTSREEFIKLLDEKNLDDVLQRIPVKEGDVLYTPAGRVHALGPGIMLAEIQQSSDLTYRVYDFDRKGNDGKPRELHLQDALLAMDYSSSEEVKTKYHDKSDQTFNLTQKDCFTVNRLRFKKPVIKDLSSLDSFVIYLCLKGRINLGANHSTLMKAGEAVLVPANMDSISLLPEKESLILEIYIA